jgi:hypothetical protein
MAVLFMSGYVESAFLSTTRPDVPLLLKPFRADHLIEAVRSALDSAGG